MKPSLLLAMMVACGKPDPTGTGPDAPPPVPEAVDPGSRTMGRLNRTEYDLVIADLLGTDKTPAADLFPADETAFGYDNVGSALTTTSVHVELWEVATDLVLDEMFGRNEEESERIGFQAEDAGVAYVGDGGPYLEDYYAIFDGSLSATFAMPYDGTFEIRTNVFGRAVGGETPVLEVRVDGVPVGTSIVTATINPEVYTVTTEISVGVHAFEIALANPYTDLAGSKRSITVDWVEIEGPTYPEGGRTAAYDEWVSCASDGLPDPDCARDSIEDFGRAAWRRALSDEDVDWAMGLYDLALDEGADEGEALQLAFKGLMLAPEFFYRIEADPEGSAPRSLDGYEVATRLAAFLWSSSPDEELLVAAEDGTLLEEGGVERHVRRMIADGRSQALVDNLAGQWLDIRQIETVSPDPTLYPNFDEVLRASMQEEMRLLADGFFRGTDDFGAMLVRQEAWIDQRLADHYDLAFAPSDTFELTPLDGTGRAGLFGTAGWLAAQSRTDGPSAVKRGKWVIENLFCSPPPPPPPDVEGIVTSVPDEGSVRQQEEEVRGEAYCQGCHGAMDPLGFVLGGFDATGAARGFDELGYPIDSLVVYDGTSLSSALDLATLVANDPRVDPCAVEQTLIYAIGRPIRVEDGPVVSRIANAFSAGGRTFESLAVAIATSEPFLQRAAPAEVLP